MRQRNSQKEFLIPSTNKKTSGLELNFAIISTLDLHIYAGDIFFVCLSILLFIIWFTYGKVSDKKFNIESLLLIFIVLLIIIGVYDFIVYFLISDFKETNVQELSILWKSLIEPSKSDFSSIRFLFKSISFFLLAYTFWIFHPKSKFQNLEQYTGPKLTVESVFILIFSFIGVLNLFIARDFFHLYISLELYALPLLGLLVMAGAKNEALDYLIFNTIFSLLTLFFYLKIMSHLDKVNFYPLILEIHQFKTFDIPVANQSMVFSLFCGLFIALFAKCLVAPFIIFAVFYEKLHPIALLYSLSVTKLGSFYIFYILNLYSKMFCYHYIDNLYIIFGIISVFIGTLGTFRSKKFYSFIIYLSIISAGFLVFALISVTNIIGFYSFVFYLIFSSGLLLLFGALFVKIESRLDCQTELIPFFEKIPNKKDKIYFILIILNLMGFPLSLLFFCKMGIYYQLSEVYPSSILFPILILNMVTYISFFEILKILFFLTSSKNNVEFYKKIIPVISPESIKYLYVIFFISLIPFILALLNLYR